MLASGFTADHAELSSASRLHLQAHGAGSLLASGRLSAGAVDFKGSFKGNYRVPLKGFGVI